jgi:hypothetical protein
MELVGTDEARQGFEELLAAASEEQLARLHAAPGPQDEVASGEHCPKVEAPESKWQHGTAVRKEKMP